MKITVDSEQYLGHRLAFFYQTGIWPPDGVDHKEQPRHNNSWDNLRPATQSQNLRNTGPRSDSATGLKMIQQRKPGAAYTVRSRIDGKPRHFGSYKNLDDAIAVAAQVVLTFHGDFARV